MKIEGLFFKYHGDNWKSSKQSEWPIAAIKKSDRITGERAGYKKLHGRIASVYACDQCPHTFYGDYND